MIIKSEANRMKAWALLRDAELPCEFWLFEGEAIKITQGHNPKDKTYNFNLVMDATDFYDYPDTPEPTLGDHTSGMVDNEEHW